MAREVRRRGGDRDKNLVGLVIGAITAAGAWWLLQWNFLIPVAERYARLLRPWISGRRDRWFISCCAGVGEELLFRGAVQYWLGVPLTAIIFVALHGYLNPRNARVSVYGAYLVLCMWGFGLIVDRMGLLPAMVAHVLVFRPAGGRQLRCRTPRPLRQTSG